MLCTGSASECGDPRSNIIAVTAQIESIAKRFATAATESSNASKTPARAIVAAAPATKSANPSVWSKARIRSPAVSARNPFFIA